MQLCTYIAIYIGASRKCVDKKRGAIERTCTYRYATIVSSKGGMRKGEGGGAVLYMRARVLYIDAWGAIASRFYDSHGSYIICFTYL